MLGGWAKAGRMPAEIVVSDVGPERADSFGRRPSPTSARWETIIRKRPAKTSSFWPSIRRTSPLSWAIFRASLKPDAILISLAPKWTIDKTRWVAERFHSHRQVDPQCAVDRGPRLQPDRLQSLPDGAGSKRFGGVVREPGRVARSGGRQAGELCPSNRHGAHVFVAAVVRIAVFGRVVWADPLRGIGRTDGYGPRCGGRHERGRL